MKKLYLLLILLAFAAIAQAQHIAVKDFYYAENDLTARTYGTSMEDQNGNLCALIKIETTEKGLWTFDVGMLGVTKTEMQNANHSAEIWVYVPFSVTWITIQHDRFGKLNRYQFPCSIEKGCTYVMELVTGRVETIVKEDVRMQYLAFQITPPNAVLLVNDELWDVGNDGTAMKFVDFGTYTYRVQAPNYHVEMGKVTVDDPTDTQRVQVDLKPDFVEVTFKVDADAEIWVNDEKKGIRIWTGPMGKGSYKIECKQEGHETTVVTQKITSDMVGKTITLPKPEPIYGSLNVESTPFATLYIDGKEMGETPKFIKDVLVGEHILKLTKDGYADCLQRVIIIKGERTQVKVSLLSHSISDISNNDVGSSGSYNGHDYVDLDLPSGTLWATCNVGADTPEDYGNYYAWGEKRTKKKYTWDNYRYCNDAYDKLTKYCSNSNYGNDGFTDGLTVLQATDDAATANWGDGWCMPTKEQWDELSDNTTMTLTTRNGIYGRLYVAMNGNMLFLPAAGCRTEEDFRNVGDNGYYWSSSLYSDYPSDAWFLIFGSGKGRGLSMGYDRYYGRSVRAVRSASQN